MRIQEICITSLTLVAFVCLLGQNGLALNQITKHQRFIRADEIPKGDAILDENSLRSEHNLRDTLIGNTTKYIKEIEIKSSENKKKILGLIDGIAGLGKSKNETKYHKPKDSKMEEKTIKLPGLFVTEPITLPTNTSDQVNKNIHHLSDFLLNSQPIVNSTLINVEKISTQFEAKESNFSRARALNISAPEPINSLNANLTDLSDVSMDDEDKEVEGGEYIANHTDTYTTMTPVILLSELKCMENNKTYAVGDKIIRNCNEKCVCGKNGTIQNCEPLCISPYVRVGKGTQDPFCHEQKVSEDGCCAVVVCADSAPEPDETCFFANKTILRGQRVEDGCTKTCFCDVGGVLKCEPRCPPNETTSEIHNHDRCVALADPRDPCCTITYCDVSLGEHEIKSENVADLSVSLTDVKVLNSTAVKLKLSSELTNNTVIEISKNDHIWSQQNPDKGGILSNLEPAHSYYIRITEEGRTGPAIRVTLPAEVIKTNITEKMDKNSCSHRGKLYKIGAEWYDECISFCVCNEGAKTECITIECPTDFGLDVLDPHCLDWETVPPNFVAKAPHCCPQEVRCRNNGSCDYEGKTYDNWSEIPSNITGCEKRCYCDMGKVSCQAACPPVLALPPASLQCPNGAILAKLPHDECCSHWICDPKGSSSSGLPEDTYTTNFPIHTGISTYSDDIPGQPLTNEVVIKALDALDEKTVRLIFTVPSVLVGLHGRVELRYTSDKTNMDPSTWKSQVFIPPNDIIATPQLEFELDGLEPATEYKVRVTVNLRDIRTSPSSKIYSVRTLNKHEELTTLPPQIPIDAELRVMEINSSWINVIWKKFTEYELEFIDGVQLRYKEHDSKVYATTSLIHRAVTNYVIENLKPSTTYEIGISIIPFPGQTTELISERTIQITTSVEPDPYSFDVKVEIKMVKSQDVEISWSGVPYPEDKYVNIYRAIYQSDSGKGDTSTFKIAKRDSPAKTIISDLKPGTRYRLWLEVYLTNGRIKKSNVQDFITKPGTVLSVGISQQGKLASIPLREGNYYGPLVIVAIVASLAILSTLILLMMLMKRRSSSKADISPRKTTSAYDNPSYKTCEEIVTITNGRNRASEHEMSAINSNFDTKESA